MIAQGGHVFGGSGHQQESLVNTLVQTVKRDVEQAEGGKQWSFSCYSPAKECPSLPGIEDVSPEELRWEAYDAKGNPSRINQHHIRCQELARSFAQKRQMLLNPSEEMKETFRRIYNRGLSTAGGALVPAAHQRLFEAPQQQQNPSIFGGSKPTFGSTSASQSVFASPSSSVFGAPIATAAPPTSFGQTTSIFGGSVFGTPQAQTSKSIFSQQSTSTSPFLAGPSNPAPLPPAPAVSIFGQPNVAMQTQPFGTPKSPNPPAIVVGTTSKIFAGREESAAPKDPVNLFAPPSHTPSSTLQTGLFGQTIQAQKDDSLYTDISKLLPNELEAFKSENFTLGQIPECPPPKELCF